MEGIKKKEESGEKDWEAISIFLPDIAVSSSLGINQYQLKDRKTPASTRNSPTVNLNPITMKKSKTGSVPKMSANGKTRINSQHRDWESPLTYQQHVRYSSTNFKAKQDWAFTINTRFKPTQNWDTLVPQSTPAPSSLMFNTFQSTADQKVNEQNIQREESPNPTNVEWFNEKSSRFRRNPPDSRQGIQEIPQKLLRSPYYKQSKSDNKMFNGIKFDFKTPTGDDAAKIGPRIKRAQITSTERGPISLKRYSSESTTFRLAKMKGAKPKKLPSILEMQRRDEVSMEIQQKLKEVIPREFSAMIRAGSGISISQPELAISYKYYLGQGNNSYLIAHALSARCWWVKTENVEYANFVWMQQTDRSVFSSSHIQNEIAHGHTQSQSRPLCQPIIKQVNLRRKRVEAELERLQVPLITGSQSYKARQPSVELNPLKLKVYNRLARNHNLANKKSLFKNMKSYYESTQRDVFDIIPLTYHIQTQEDLSAFLEEQQNTPTWIVKPGEWTNRGKGIEVCGTANDVQELILSLNESNHTFIVQKYIENPLLINKRKFDIRWFALITSSNGNRQAYFYKEGYIRTSWREFSMSNLDDKYIHLTNDAVQKTAAEYGRFESGNKLNYEGFQKYLDTHHVGMSMIDDIIPQIETIVLNTILAVYDKLDPANHLHNFEVFGYDFMVDDQFKVWLIEVNTNPCLETGCINLQRIIPNLIDNALRIALDPYFPMPYAKRANQDQLIENKFELIFNEIVDINSQK